MNQTEQAAVWALHARQWSKVGPPLKPSQDDLRLMIATVWASHPGGSSTVTQAQWQKLPFEDAHFYAVVGDGALNVLTCRADYADVAAQGC